MHQYILYIKRIKGIFKRFNWKLSEIDEIELEDRLPELLTMVNTIKAEFNSMSEEIIATIQKQ